MLAGSIHEIYSFVTEPGICSWGYHDLIHFTLLVCVLDRYDQSSEKGDEEIFHLTESIPPILV